MSQIPKNPKPKKRKGGFLRLEIGTRLSAEDKIDRELIAKDFYLEPLTDEEIARIPESVDEFIDRVIARRHAARTRHARGPSTACIPKWGRPLCGAKTRKGTPCQAPPVWDKANNRPRNGRCRMHGGLSTGPKTPEGKAKALSKLKNYRGRSLD